MVIAQHRKPMRFNRATALLVAIIILATATVSTTVAFLITGTDSIMNFFLPSEVKTEVKPDSTSDGMTYKIKNVGDTECYIRAAVIVNWVKTDSNGVTHVYADKPEVDMDYNIVYNSNEEKSWIKKDYGDGEIIYYSVSPIAVNAHTANLISKFRELDSPDKPEGYELAIEIVATGIQSTPRYVVENEWEVTLDSNGKITAVK